MKTILLIFLIFAFSKANEGTQTQQYAVLVAGSSGYFNYRHQADICHAYQILVKDGIPKSNIIVMAYDDIAYSPHNPFLGQIYNSPSEEGQPRDNVYAGCNIDYSGADVTIENYLAIITGNQSGVRGGNGRILESKKSDQVFLNFVDHGFAGGICFPKDQMMYADQLNLAFLVMRQKGMFKQLTMYLETCYSGSMFEQTPKDIRVYAVSASSPDQSSFATYCPPRGDIVDGKNVGTCLGDLFSVNWMENTEIVNNQIETLEQQYNIVQKETEEEKNQPGSDSMQWGDDKFTTEQIGLFLGFQNQEINRMYEKYNINFNRERKQKLDAFKQDRIPASQNQLNFYISQYEKNPSDENLKILMDDINKTMKLEEALSKFTEKHDIYYKLYRGTQFNDTDFCCYRHLINSLTYQCGNFNDASLYLTKYLYDFCNFGLEYEGTVFECENYM